MVAFNFVWCLLCRNIYCCVLHTSVNTSCKSNISTCYMKTTPSRQIDSGPHFMPPAAPCQRRSGHQWFFEPGRMQSSGCLLEVFGVASDYLLHIDTIHIPNCERRRYFTVCCRGKWKSFSYAVHNELYSHSDAIKYWAPATDTTWHLKRSETMMQLAFQSRASNSNYYIAVLYKRWNILVGTKTFLPTTAVYLNL